MTCECEEGETTLCGYHANIAQQWIDAEVERLNAKPVPLLLVCPSCGYRHIDEGEFATKVHHTHACQYCGMVWRPAIGPTVGVAFLPGFKNGAR